MRADSGSMCPSRRIRSSYADTFATCSVETVVALDLSWVVVEELLGIKSIVML